MTGVPITSVEQLLELPEKAVLVGRDNIAWGRGKGYMQLWRALDGGGYGSSSGDLVEITQRFYRNESPLTLVFWP